MGPNVLSLEKRFAFRPRDFRRWIAIHELTHRAQFTAVPWMRGHFMTLVRAFARHGRARPARSCARSLVRPSRSRGQESFDEAGCSGCSHPRNNARVLSEVQALMSLLEGHGNFVMNALARVHVQGVERMERVLQARRNTRASAASCRR